MPQDIIGWIHTLTALIALITGSMILANEKGTRRHKLIGRIYGVSMLVVCVTSFMIYRVHGTFGVLHFFAVVSTVTLLLGMLPLYTGWGKNPIVAHLSWMYWSVIGLYCAFAAEVFTRLPMLLDLENSYGIFYALVGLSAGVVSMVGSRYFKTKKGEWEQRFA